MNGLDKRGVIAVLFALVVLTLAAFLPALQGDFLSWDDDVLLVQNSAYRGFSAARWSWMCTTVLVGHWQPLTWLSYAVDYQLYGMDPRGWHGTNLLLHLLNALLVYRLTLLLSPRIGARKSLRPGLPALALLATLFWSVHPLRVEAVGWLSTRGYLLCSTFCLLATDGYIRAVREGRYPYSAFLFFLLASATKGIGMMLPVAWLLLDWIPLRRITFQKSIPIQPAVRLVLEKLPFFALSFITGALSFYAKKTDGGMVPVHYFGPFERAGQALSSIWFYLSKTISPQHLSPIYDQRPTVGMIVLSVSLSIALLALFLFFRHRLKSLMATVGMFLVLISPMLGITQSGAQVFADRFTYLASVPFSIFLSQVRFQRKWLRRTAFLATTLLVVVFSVQSNVYTRIWSSSLRFWYTVLDENPQSERALFGVGNAWKEAGDCNRAIPYFDLALEKNPTFPAAWSNRGTCRLQQGDIGGAINDFTAALETRQLRRPDDHARVLLLRASAAEKAGLVEQALQDVQAVSSMAEADPLLRIRGLMTRARLLTLLNQHDEARADIETALRLPDVTGAYHERLRQALDLINSPHR